MLVEGIHIGCIIAIKFYPFSSFFDMMTVNVYGLFVVLVVCDGVATDRWYQENILKEKVSLRLFVLDTPAYLGRNKLPAIGENLEILYWITL